jgi:hypothetical protein
MITGTTKPACESETGAKLHDSARRRRSDAPPPSDAHARTELDVASIRARQGSLAAVSIGGANTRSASERR